tara:strand:+ start:268 stop:492 length:225 start_codon:yes stop_codon:yes gene_type:complete
VSKAQLYKQALEKVGNPNVLVNIISRRVKQLNSGGGIGRPLLEESATMSASEIALTELIEDKFEWELLMDIEEK